MEDKSIVFIEKQYLGRDYVRISIRLVMIMLCLVAYFFTEEHERDTANVFLIVAFSIIVVSVIMMFLLHYKITVQNQSITVNGLWTSRLVKINLNNIIGVEKISYGSHLINNPVYNLHKKGAIYFYAGGKGAVKLTDQEGAIYIIGTQLPNELEQKIKYEIKSVL